MVNYLKFDPAAMTAAECRQVAKTRLQDVAWITADSLPGMTTDQQTALAAYRAVLATMLTSTDPASITWPVKPGFLRGIV